MHSPPGRCPRLMQLSFSLKFPCFGRYRSICCMIWGAVLQFANTSGTTTGSDAHVCRTHLRMMHGASSGSLDGHRRNCSDQEGRIFSCTHNTFQGVLQLPGLIICSMIVGGTPYRSQFHLFEFVRPSAPGSKAS